MKHIKTYLPLLITLIVLLISTRALLLDEFFRVHDFTQGARVVEMFHGFKDGQIPVRWSKNFGYGYGMPTFLFYAPLPYIIGAFFYWISDNLIFSLRIVWAIPSLISFLGMYLFTKKYTGKLGALIAATAFTLAPYRAVDLYVRGAIGEIWGIAFFPWILHTIDQWYAQKKSIDIKLITSCVCLFLSHNLMTLFFFPVIATYIFLKWLAEKERRVKSILYCYAQILLAFACSAFYLIPSFIEKDLTKFDEKILGGYFQYNLHFLYLRQFFRENWKYGGSAWGPDDDMSFFLGYGQLFGIGIFVLVLCLLGFRILEKNKFSLLKSFKKVHFLQHPIFPILTISILFFPISIFLSIQKSEKIWFLLEILQTAQFPWRFLSLSIFFISLCVGLTFRFNLLSAKLKLILAAGTLILLTFPAYKYFQPEKFIKDSRSFYYEDEHRIRFEMSETWVDFLPKQFNEKLEPTDERYHLSTSEDNIKVQVLVDRSHQLLLKTSFSTPTLLSLHIGDFPGWKTYIQNTLVDHQTSKDGLIEVMVPSGEQLVSASLERTPIRFISDLISVLSFISIISSRIIVKKVL